jgi:hypothetical protein
VRAARCCGTALLRHCAARCAVLALVLALALALNFAGFSGLRSGVTLS